jgi:stage V sporulation protein B
MKNKFIKNTIILILGGFITKVLGMFIKIIMTRNISTFSMSLYTLTIPTYNLFITIVTLSLTISISKLISENKISKQKIMSSSLFISILISLFSTILLFVFIKPISLLLHNEKLFYPLLSIILSLPFISISTSIRGYFFGRNKMFIQVISNLLEQVSRIILFLLILPKINNDIQAVSFIIGSNMISEIVSIITMSLFLPKEKIRLSKPDRNVTNEILKISIPNTLQKLLSVISYFFEPIVLTNLLIINGYSNNYISTEYGIINGYTIALLMLPSFFTNAISQVIIPNLSNAYINKEYEYIKTKIKQVLILSLLLGIAYTIIIIIKKELIMSLIYNTDQGIKYINIMAPIFILLYLEGPLNSILQSFNKSKTILLTSIIGIIIKYILMIILSFLKFGIYSFIIPLLVNIVLVVLLNSIKIKKEINSF